MAKHDYFAPDPDSETDADPDALRRANRGLYPADFEAWPKRRKADWLQERFTRRGLISKVLVHTFVDEWAPEERSHGRLQKVELAAIYLEVTDEH